MARNQEKAMRHNCAMNTEPTRFWLAAVSLRRRSWAAVWLKLFSWYTQCLLLWPRRPSQHTRHRSPRTFFGRPIRPLQSTIFGKDRRHGGEADGTISANDTTDCHEPLTHYSVVIESPDHSREKSDLPRHQARQFSYWQTWL